MSTTKVRRIGRSRGVIIPAETLAAANLTTDDVLEVTVTDDGRIVLSPYDPEFDQAMAAAGFEDDEKALHGRGGWYHPAHPQFAVEQGL